VRISLNFYRFLDDPIESFLEGCGFPGLLDSGGPLEALLFMILFNLLKMNEQMGFA